MIDELWNRLEGWAVEHMPGMLDDLNDGASEQDIEILELAVRQELSDEFRTSLRIHNGEGRSSPQRIFADFGDYLSTAEILANWKQRSQIAEQIGRLKGLSDPEQLAKDGVIAVDGPVTPVLFTPGWIPIMDWNGDVFWALDFDPASGGRDGQLIEVDWEGTSWKVVAPSFGAFLSDYVQSLEAGDYRIVDGLLTRHDA